MSPYADKEEKKRADREYHDSHKEVINKRSREWRQEYPERQKAHGRRHHLLKKFGLTLEAYADLLEQQGGVCAICKTSDTFPWDWFCVDHDHATGRVRGLLCAFCNNVLGHSRENVETLRNAIDYLESRCSKL